MLGATCSPQWRGLKCQSMEIIGSSRLGEVGRYGVCTEGVDYGCGHFDRESLVNMFDCWQNICRKSFF